MPVSVKDYLDSMKQVGVSKNTKVATNNDVQIQVLLSQLLEALAYTKSMKFDNKTLKESSNSVLNMTGKEILERMKEQEKLISQLAEGQKLSDEQSKKLTEAIDNFYEMAGTAKIDYKKFAEHLEKFAMMNVPEAVQNRLINDSRDAHMIGQEQIRDNPVLNLLKKIKYSLEDSAELTKQFRKKFFVTLDEFREGFLEGLEGLKDAFEESGNIFDKILDGLQLLGMGWMAFQGQFKEGNFKWGQAFKQFDNIKTAFKAFQEIGKIGTKVKGPIKAVKDLITGTKLIFKNIASIPKFIEKLGFMKGLGRAAGGVGKGFAKGLGKGVLKKIPLIGTLMSIWMGVERWKQGDKAGAFIEFGSGVAAAFPGIGTLVSIGLDLINLGRDTGFFKNIGEGIKEKVQKIPENVYYSIPLVGTIFGTIKGIKQFKAGNKRGALGTFGKTVLSSLIPGGAWISDALAKIHAEGKDKALAEKVKETANNWNFSENAMLSIPIVGPVWGTIKAVKMFNSGNKAGALKLAAKSLASIMPGGAWVVEALSHLVNQSVEPMEVQESGGTNTEEKKKKHWWQRGGGDGVDFNIQPFTGTEYGAGDDTKGFGSRLAKVADRRKLGWKSKGKCGLYVGNAVSEVLGEGVARQLRGNGKDWAKSLKNSTGKKYFDSKGVEGNLSNLKNLPAGSILSWPAAGRHKYGHVEIADGHGNLISDFKRVAGQIYRDTPSLRPSVFTPKDGVKSNYTASNDVNMNSTSNEGTTSEVEQAEEPQTFDELMQAFTDFNTSLVEGVSSPSGKAWVSDSASAPSMEDLFKVSEPAPVENQQTKTTNGSISPYSPSSRPSYQPQQQTVQTTMGDPQPEQMDTDIVDTSLALLNSILFQ